MTKPGIEPEPPASQASTPAKSYSNSLLNCHYFLFVSCRSLAIEKAYVHDVYEQISATFSDSRYRAWPRVKQFLMDLEPGAIVCDVGKDLRV
jgi:hypothetical protein